MIISSNLKEEDKKGHVSPQEKKNSSYYQNLKEEKTKAKPKNIDHIQYFKEEEEIAKPNLKGNINADEFQN